MRALKSLTIVLMLLGAGCSGDADSRSGAGSALRSENGQSRVVLVDGEVALECGPGPVGEIQVEFDCDEITIYSCKDLSNVVIEYENGERERFEGLSGQIGGFSGAGERIVTVWVKAGANFSGDGPGYGDRFEAPTGSCDDPPGGGAGNGGDQDPCEDFDPDTVCSEGDVPPGGDEPGDEEGGGDPQTCVDDSSDPTCQVD